MKILLIFGVLLSAPMGLTDTISEQLALEVTKDVLACMVGFGMPAVEESDQEPLNFRDPKYRCLQSCVLTRLGLLKDMEMNIEDFSMIFHRLYPEEQAISKIKAHMDCIEEEKNQLFEDGCDYANKHMRCVRVKMGYLRIFK